MGSGKATGLKLIAFDGGAHPASLGSFESETEGAPHLCFVLVTVNTLQSLSAKFYGQVAQAYALWRWILSCVWASIKKWEKFAAWSFV